MFQTGDRIQVEKGLGRTIRARILRVEFSNATYRALVLREDNGKEDVFVWNIYQDEISVKKLAGEMSLEELKILLKTEYNRGFAAGKLAADKEWKKEI